MEKTNKNINKYGKRKIRRLKLGTVSRQILLLLEANVALGVVRNPNRQIRILKNIPDAWDEIDRRKLREAIGRLYKSKLIRAEDNEDGTTSLILSDEGKKVCLRYKIDDIEISKPKKWDRLWRMVIFDIPEEMRFYRKELADKLFNLGFKPIQKSVFIYPYECKEELDFIIEYLGIREYVRVITVVDIDIEPELTHHFKL